MQKLPHGSFNQFNYVTFDIRKTIDHWVAALGAGPFYCWELNDPDLTPSRTYRGKPARDTFKACYGFLGASMIEFMQPTNDAPSLLREVLDLRGEALQHIFPRIRPLTPSDYDAISDGYVRAGYECASTATVPMYGRNSFFDARHAIGAFIELVELLPPSFEIIEGMYEAHIDWDGARPMRGMAELADKVMGTNNANSLDSGLNWWV